MIIKFPKKFDGNRGISANPSGRPRIDFSTEFGRLYADRIMSEKLVKIKSTGQKIMTRDVVLQVETADQAKATINDMLQNNEAHDVSIHCLKNEPIDFSGLEAKIPREIGWDTESSGSIEIGIIGNLNAKELGSIVSNGWNTALVISASGSFFHSGIFYGDLLFSSVQRSFFLGAPKNSE
jgi:hypothetical protein